MQGTPSPAEPKEQTESLKEQEKAATETPFAKIVVLQTSFLFILSRSLVLITLFKSKNRVSTPGVFSDLLSSIFIREMLFWRLHWFSCYFYHHPYYCYFIFFIMAGKKERNTSVEAEFSIAAQDKKRLDISESISDGDSVTSDEKTQALIKLL